MRPLKDVLLIDIIIVIILRAVFLLGVSSARFPRWQNSHSTPSAVEMNRIVGINCVLGISLST